MNNQPFQITLTGPNEAIFDLADQLGFDAPFMALAISIFEVDNETSSAQALYETQAEAKAALSTLNIAPPIRSAIKQLPDEDWVSKSQEGLKPIKAGQFLIYGTHDADKIDLTGKTGLQIDAGLAFGSGHHGTTSGCLVLFDRLLEQNIIPQNILDLGCGAGILSIGAAKVLDHNTAERKILATDIDQDAVNVTLQNAILNDVADKITAKRVDGFEDPVFKGQRFDLIFANILAGPLMALAHDIADHMDMGHYVIMSGILKEQKNTVATHFNSHGLDIIDDEPQGEWVSLLGRKVSA